MSRAANARGALAPIVAAVAALAALTLASRPAPVRAQPLFEGSGPLAEDRIWDHLFARIGVLDFGAAGVLAHRPREPRGAFVGRLTLVARESNGMHFDALRAALRISGGVTRFDGRLLGLDEVAIGTSSEGSACVPSLFVVWPPGECRSTSGLFGFGVSALEVDYASDREEVAMRLVEAQARLVLPGEAHGPRYPVFRAPLWLGASLDWAGETIPRVGAGAELLVRSDDKHFEAGASIASRLALTHGLDDLLFDTTAHLTYRAIGGTAGTDRLLALALEGGFGYATRPRSTIGEMLSRDDRVSAWALLRLEVTLVSVAGT